MTAMENILVLTKSTNVLKKFSATLDTKLKVILFQLGIETMLLCPWKIFIFDDKEWIGEHFVKPVNRKLGKWILCDVIPNFYSRKIFRLKDWYAGTNIADKKRQKTRLSRITYSSDRCGLNGLYMGEILYNELMDWVKSLYKFTLEDSGVVEISDVAQQISEKWLEIVRDNMRDAESKESMLANFCSENMFTQFGEAYDTSTLEEVND